LSNGKKLESLFIHYSGDLVVVGAQFIDMTKFIFYDCIKALIQGMWSTIYRYDISLFL